MSNKIDLYLIAFGTVLYLYQVEENIFMNEKGWYVELAELIPTSGNLEERSRVWAQVDLYPAIDDLAYYGVIYFESELSMGTSLVYMDQGGYRYVVLS